MGLVYAEWQARANASRRKARRAPSLCSPARILSVLINPLISPRSEALSRRSRAHDFGGVLGYIGAGCRLDRFVLCVAWFLRRHGLLARVRLEPVGPMRPPTARVRLRRLEPRIRTVAKRAVGPIAALVL